MSNSTCHYAWEKTNLAPFMLLIFKYPTTNYTIIGYNKFICILVSIIILLIQILMFHTTRYHWNNWSQYPQWRAQGIISISWYFDGPRPTIILTHTSVGRDCSKKKKTVGRVTILRIIRMVLMLCCFFIIVIVVHLWTRFYLCFCWTVLIYFFFHCSCKYLHGRLSLFSLFCIHLLT